MQKSQLHDIFVKKKQPWGSWSLLREITLSYDVSLVFPGESQAHWLIKSQNVYLPGFIQFSCLIDFR